MVRSPLIRIQATGRRPQNSVGLNEPWPFFGLWPLEWPRLRPMDGSTDGNTHICALFPRMSVRNARSHSEVHTHSAVTALICLVRIMCVVHVWIACLGIVQGDSGGRVPGLG